MVRLLKYVVQRDRDGEATAKMQRRQTVKRDSGDRKGEEERRGNNRRGGKIVLI
jgi:hypothetical protein